MREGFRLFIMGILFWISGNAQARPPESDAEKALLYWRYLCRGSPQHEKKEGGHTVFECPSQSWSVVGPLESGVIEEIRDLAH